MRERKKEDVRGRRKFRATTLLTYHAHMHVLKHVVLFMARRAPHHDAEPSCQCYRCNCPSPPPSPVLPNGTATGEGEGSGWLARLSAQKVPKMTSRYDSEQSN